MHEGIFVFTKDRPEILLKCIKNISHLDIPIVVLDDSFFRTNSQVLKRKLAQFPNARYHGRRDQKKAIVQSKCNNHRLKTFINHLGTETWNLGYARNYAILLGRLKGYTKILLMDDDIIIENRTLIRTIFNKLNTYDFVGSKVVGMIDDSIVGYIVRELRIPPEEYFSGGFIAFKTSIVSHHFINKYNEDWIWLFMHQATCSMLQYGTVRQLPYNYYRNALDKAMSQEIGEIMADGVKEAFLAQDFGLLIKHGFWREILNEKKVYYNQLIERSIHKNRDDLSKILLGVRNYSLTLDENIFVKMFRGYVRDNRQWNKILNKISQ